MTDIVITPGQGIFAFTGSDGKTTDLVASGTDGGMVLVLSGGALLTEEPLSCSNGVVASGASVDSSLGFSGSLTALTDGTPYLRSLGGISITTESNGSLIISGSADTVGAGGGGDGADPGVSYIVVANTASLANERALVGGTGIILTDQGANLGITASIDDDIVATVSGTTFTGAITAPFITASSGMSASNLAVGEAVLASVGTLTPTAATDDIGADGTRWDHGWFSDVVTCGKIAFSNGGDSVPNVAGLWDWRTDGSNTAYLWYYGSWRLLFKTGVGLLPNSVGNEHLGSAALPWGNLHLDSDASIGGNTYCDGVVTASSGLSGSLTALVDGTPYLRALGGISITSESNGSIIISGSGAGGGGAASSIIDHYTYHFAHPAPPTHPNKEYYDFTGQGSSDGAASTLTDDREMVAPHDGELVSVMMRTSQNAASTIIGFHTGSNTTAVETDTQTVGANTSVKFSFADSTFSAGDLLGISVDPTNGIMENHLTAHWKFDTST